MNDSPLPYCGHTPGKFPRSKIQSGLEAGLDIGIKEMRELEAQVTQSWVVIGTASERPIELAI